MLEMYSKFFCDRYYYAPCSSAALWRPLASSSSCSTTSDVRMKRRKASPSLSCSSPSGTSRMSINYCSFPWQFGAVSSKAFLFRTTIRWRRPDYWENFDFVIQHTAEPAYSYIVYSRFLAIVELNLVPFAFISLLFYPCYSRLLF